MSDWPITITTTPQQAIDFLNGMIDDEEFRKRYESDPRAVLAQYGVFLPPEAVAGKAAAPDPGALRRIRDELERSQAGIEMCSFVFFGFAKGA